MLISRAIYIENENVNLEKDAQETAHTQSACLRASCVVSGKHMDPTKPKYDRAFLELAHKSCSSHKDEIISSSLCGCFYCQQTFKPTEIEEWIEENLEKGETAICPKCGIDSVLSSNFPIEDERFLQEMQDLWFQ